VGVPLPRRDGLAWLNEVLAAELTSVNRYFADAKMCANWGYDRVGETVPENCCDSLATRTTSRDRFGADHRGSS
jgi:bacterioferritin (cytochrome b1)